MVPFIGILLWGSVGRFNPRIDPLLLSWLLTTRVSCRTWQATQNYCHKNNQIIIRVCINWLFTDSCTNMHIPVCVNVLSLVSTIYTFCCVLCTRTEPREYWRWYRILKITYCVGGFSVLLTCQVNTKYSVYRTNGLLSAHAYKADSKKTAA